jgi:hypothetical protein
MPQAEALIFVPSFQCVESPLKRWFFWGELVIGRSKPPSSRNFRCFCYVWHLFKQGNTRSLIQDLKSLPCTRSRQWMVRLRTIPGSMNEITSNFQIVPACLYLELSKVAFPCPFSFKKMLNSVCLLSPAQLRFGWSWKHGNALIAKFRYTPQVSGSLWSFKLSHGERYCHKGLTLKLSHALSLYFENNAVNHPRRHLRRNQFQFHFQVPSRLSNWHLLTIMLLGVDMSQKNVK